MNDTLSGIAVSRAESGQKLLQWLKRRLDVPQGQLHKWIRTGQIRVNGGRVKAFASVQEGDIITVVGPKGSYKGDPQMVDVSVEDHKAVTEATLSEFIAAEKADDVWYRLTGTVNDIYNETYGNFRCDRIRPRCRLGRPRQGVRIPRHRGR